MKKHSIRHFIVNILCAFVWNEKKRKHVRVVLNSDVGKYIRFIRRDIGGRIRKIKTFSGPGAHSLLISVNDEWIYKFPLRYPNWRERATREKRGVDAMAKLLPIYVPSIDCLPLGDIFVRKYPFVHGVGIDKLSIQDQVKHREKIAHQVAKFVYTMSTLDPAELVDLKPTPDTKPGFMYGWWQGDIYGNFMLDPKTFDVIAFIDFENVRFGDFSAGLGPVYHPREYKEMGTPFMAVVRREYIKLYRRDHPDFQIDEK